MNLRLARVAAAVFFLSATLNAVAEPRTRSAAATKGAAAKDPKLALPRLVSKHAAESGIDRELRGYSLSPQLVQLRRYVEPGQDQLKVICIVSIALKDPSDSLVGEVKGTASTSDGNALDALDAAARAAVLRVPSALAKLRASSDSKLARR